ncbi:MAG: prepilin-type N-terminal cleavage/methylation domain-containing protein [Thermodesulfobacteriota bacterium]
MQEKGFTLIEVLIALTVFAFGILAVAAMQTTAAGGNAKARYISEATSWATDQLETLMNLDYDDPLLTDGGGTNNGTAGLDDGPVAGTTADGATASTDGSYTIYWNVATDVPVIDTKTIRVIVVHGLLNTPTTIDFIRTAGI